MAPPSPFPASGDELRAKLLKEFELDDAGQLALLDTAGRALDLALQAEAQLSREGMTVKGRHGPVAHPCIKVAREARGRLMAALKHLKLER